MGIILNILAFLGAIFLLIIIHELAHFLVARWCGVKILRFSIGFGKALFKWCDKLGTEYVLALVPLGGYVKMLDGREMEVKAEEKHLTFDVKPIWQRLFIILAGPLSNMVFGIVVFWLILVVGVMQPKTILGDVVAHSVASAAGLQTKDEITAIANKKVQDWQGIILTLFSYVGDKVDLPVTIKREKQNGFSVEKTFNLDLRQWKLDEWHPDPLRDLGIMPYQPFIPVVAGDVASHSPAEKAGLVAGDKIISINEQHFSDWMQMIDFIRMHPNQKLLFVIDRQGKTMQKMIVSGWRFGEQWHKVGYLGIQSLPVQWPAEMMYEEKYSLFGAVMPAIKQSYDFIAFNVIVLQKLFTGKLTLRVLGGPISIFQSAAVAAQKGVMVYVGFLGMLSLMLAFVNLLPIPALDGGYILFLCYETIIRKPLSLRVQTLILRFGLIFLVLLMSQGVFNDFKRLFW